MPPIDSHRNTTAQCGHRESPLMRVSLFSCLQRASCISVLRTMCNTNLRSRQCSNRTDRQPLLPKMLSKALDWHSTHVICQVLCLVTCSSGVRWTTRIESTAGKIVASAMRRSSESLKHVCSLANPLPPTGHVRHFGSRIGKTCQFVEFSRFWKTHRTNTPSCSQSSVGVPAALSVDTSHDHMWKDEEA